MAQPRVNKMPVTMVGVVALLGAGVAGAARAAPFPKQTDVGNRQTLVVAYHQPPADLDPATSYDGPAAAVLRNEYEGLVRLRGKSTTRIQGALARSWRNSQGGKVWTFFLRRNVRFHDGAPLTAPGVKAWIDHVLTVNQGPAFIIGTFVKPSGIRAVNRYTLRFTLKAPSDVFIRAMAAQWGTWIASPRVLRMGQKKLHTWFQTHEAGTGPYRLQQLVPGQSLTLTRFSQYWRGWSGRHVSRVIVNVVTADATRRELVEKGNADLTETLTPNDLVAMRANKSLVVDASYGMTNLALVMTEAGPLKSPPARRAMAYAFDYNGFIRGVLKGFGRQSQGPLPRTFLGHDFSLPLYPTDLAKARSLLRQAGVKSGTTMTMWYQSEDETTRNAALVMQAQLAQLGIQLKLEARNATAIIGEYYGNAPAARRPNFFVWYWYPDYNDPGDWLYPQYDSRAVGSAGANGGYYKNPTVDRLLERAAIMSRTAPRLRLYRQVQRIVTWTDPAAVFLADLPESTVYRKTLHGYYLNPVYTATYDYYAMWKS